MNKKFTFLFFFVIIAIASQAQDFSGTWKGVFHTDMRSFRRSFNFTIQLQQSGRAVWGIYITGDSTEGHCICKISGQVGKKDKYLINFYKDAVIEAKIPNDICDFVTYLEGQLFQKSSKKYLAGKWYGIQASSYRPDGASGVFVLQKVNDTIFVNVDKYFPRIEKYIEKSNPADTFFARQRTQTVSTTIKKPTLPQKEISDFILNEKRSVPVPKSVLNSAPPIGYLSKRKIETIRTVNFTSDSLILSLYDNGEVDGDTVSVLLNGKNIMPRQALSAKAITKTIYITPDLGDSLQLIMYAENLGSIPPNTGLLIIRDGKNIYEINFAGDMQKNAAIILKRKQK